MDRVKIGDTVRLYGYPGTFTVRPYTGTVSYDKPTFHAEPAGDPRGGFATPEASVIEVNGRPLPLLSAPLVPPAADYPHEPLFDYHDGPQELGQDALRRWREGRQPAAGTPGHEHGDPVDADYYCECGLPWGEHAGR